MNKLQTTLTQLLILICVLALSGCRDDSARIEEKLIPKITIKNNLQSDVVVVLAPSGVSDEYLDRDNFYTATHIENGTTERCKFYVSYEGYYFSASKVLDVVIVDRHIWAEYSLSEIINSPSLHLTKESLDDGALLLSNCVGRVNESNGEIRIVWGY
ncbi:hypothetical protein [uncultured Muribaculum sp.]|uniref:hypothetical protein n=1 Tax=uncultured Muribaculum sp. TaxID=1918613 RepID=UPI0025AA0DFC|nr:hypothetical protein [uncultured Muribaculum sp.]